MGGGDCILTRAWRSGGTAVLVTPWSSTFDRELEGEIFIPGHIHGF